MLMLTLLVGEVSGGRLHCRRMLVFNISELVLERRVGRRGGGQLRGLVRKLGRR